MTSPQRTEGAVGLDNEAYQALQDSEHPKHRTLMEYLEALREDQADRARAVLVPTAVRVEAAWSGRTNRWKRVVRTSRARDVPLDSHGADAAAHLKVMHEGSVVDIVVAAVAIDQEHPVTVLTSDTDDLERLLQDSPGVEVRRV